MKIFCDQRRSRSLGAILDIGERLRRRVPVLVLDAFLEMHNVDVDSLAFLHFGRHQRFLERHNVAFLRAPFALDA